MPHSRMWVEQVLEFEDDVTKIRNWIEYKHDMQNVSRLPLDEIERVAKKFNLRRKTRYVLANNITHWVQQTNDKLEEKATFLVAWLKCKAISYSDAKHYKNHLMLEFFPSVETFITVQDDFTVLLQVQGLMLHPFKVSFDADVGIMHYPGKKSRYGDFSDLYLSISTFMRTAHLYNCKKVEWQRMGFNVRASFHPLKTKGIRNNKLLVLVLNHANAKDREWKLYHYMNGLLYFIETSGNGKQFPHPFMDSEAFFNSYLWQGIESEYALHKDGDDNDDGGEPSTKSEIASIFKKNMVEGANKKKDEVESVATEQQLMDQMSKIDIEVAQKLYDRLDARLWKDGKVGTRPRDKLLMKAMQNTAHRADELKYPFAHAMELVDWLLRGNAFQFAASVATDQTRDPSKPKEWDRKDFRQVEDFSDCGSGGEDGWKWYILKNGSDWILAEECSQDQDGSFDERDVGIRGWVAHSIESLVQECMSDHCKQVMFEVVEYTVRLKEFLKDL